MGMKSQTQRSLLFAFIGSISLCGLIGIYFLLIGELSDLAGRVLASTAAVGAASILGLGASIPWERKRWQPIGPVGMVASAVALALILCLIWINAIGAYEDDDVAAVLKLPKNQRVLCLLTIGFPKT